MMSGELQHIYPPDKDRQLDQDQCNYRYNQLFSIELCGKNAHRLLFQGLYECELSVKD